MASTARHAILKALIEGAIVELMVKTKVDNVFVDDSTTVAAKLSEIITSLNAKATKTEMETALDEIPTKTEMEIAINNAITSLINGAPEAYNTLKELSDGLAEHADLVETLTAAIGSKADTSTVIAIQATIDALGSLATKSTISESDLDAALKEKVNAASEGNHSHSNKALLDTYTQSNTALSDAVAKKHSHDNKSVLDGITAAGVAAWDGKGKVYYSASQPTGLTANDLWVQLV